RGASEREPSSCTSTRPTRSSRSTYSRVPSIRSPRARVGGRDHAAEGLLPEIDERGRLLEHAADEARAQQAAVAREQEIALMVPVGPVAAGQERRASRGAIDQRVLEHVPGAVDLLDADEALLELERRLRGARLRVHERRIEDDPGRRVIGLPLGAPGLREAP